MREIGFTPAEARILQHRIDQPDCMAEVFGPDNDNVWPELSSQSDVEDFVSKVLGEMIADRPGGGMTFTLDPANPDHQMIATEVVEGNTMGAYCGDLLGFASDEPDYKKGRQLKRHLVSIERKFEAAGIAASFAL